MLVQWTIEMHLFHISENNFGVKINFNLGCRRKGLSNVDAALCHPIPPPPHHKQ